MEVELLLTRHHPPLPSPENVVAACGKAQTLSTKTKSKGSLKLMHVNDWGGGATPVRAHAQNMWACIWYLAGLLQN